MKQIVFSIIPNIDSKSDVHESSVCRCSLQSFIRASKENLSRQNYKQKELRNAKYTDKMVKKFVAIVGNFLESVIRNELPLAKRGIRVDG
jgi:hypothetical protein